VIVLVCVLVVFVAAAAVAGASFFLLGFAMAVIVPVIVFLLGFFVIVLACVLGVFVAASTAAAVAAASFLLLLLGFAMAVIVAVIVFLFTAVPVRIVPVIFGASLLPVVMGVRVIVFQLADLRLLVLDLGSQRSDVSSQDHLLSRSKIAEAALHFFWDRVNHFECSFLRCGVVCFRFRFRFRFRLLRLDLSYVVLWSADEGTNQKEIGCYHEGDLAES